MKKRKRKIKMKKMKKKINLDIISIELPKVKKHNKIMNKKFKRRTRKIIIQQITNQKYNKRKKKLKMKIQILQEKKVKIHRNHINLITVRSASLRMEISLISLQLHN